MVSKLAQTDLLGRFPQVIIDIHEIKHARRETSVTLFIEELKKNNIPYRVEKLEIGDVLLPSGYVIERKTVQDFCKSLFGTSEGRLRLKEQIENLVATYEKPILLLEGGLSVRMDPINKAIYIPVRRYKISRRLWHVTEEEIKIHPNQFEGALKELELKGMRIIKSFDEFHGAKILMGLLMDARREAQNKKSKMYPIVRSKPKLRSLQTQQLFFLSGLPGISVMRARKILKIYKTPYNAIVKVKRWDVDIEGIGQKILDQVIKVLFSEYKENREIK